MSSQAKRPDSAGRQKKFKSNGTAAACLKNYPWRRVVACVAAMPDMVTDNQAHGLVRASNSRE